MERIQGLQKIKTLKCMTMLQYLILPLFLACTLCSCTTYMTVRPDHNKIVLVSSRAEIPEEQLLDVRIQIFDPGKLPSSQGAGRGLSPEIRNAETYYIPIQLKNAMQQTGHWGAVRVVPLESISDEVLVSGRIIKSNGEQLIFEIDARTATGEKWFEKKVFKGTVSESMYKKITDNQAEVFQNVYNRIANALSDNRMKMKPDEIKKIRQVAEMRFAEDLAPSAFIGYFKKKRNNKFYLDHLPAEDDETLAIVRRVRERDYMLVDTLDAQFENIHWNMKDVYTDWRNSRLVEMNMIRKIESRRNAQRWKGAAAITGGIFLAVAGSSDGYYNPTTTAAAAAVVSVGTAMVVKAEEMTKETNINKAALEELGASFATDIKPTVLKVEGETIKLTGTAKAKYQQWRDVIGEVYRLETEADMGSIEPSLDVKDAVEPSLDAKDTIKSRPDVKDATDSSPKINYFRG